MSVPRCFHRVTRGLGGLAAVEDACICVTADDYGLTKGTNAGIERLAAVGPLTAVSIMMHANAELSSVERLRSTPCALGLHLVLVEEVPLLENRRIAGLLDSDGRLPTDYRSLFAALLRRPSLLRAIRDEAFAQMERYEGLGLPLNFVNSHQHVHLFPPIWATLRPLFVRHPVAVRAARHARPRLCKQALVEMFGCVSTLLGPERPIMHPIGLQYSGRLTKENLAMALRSSHAARSGEIAELVTHPAIEDGHLRSRYGHWNYRWQAEYELLGSDCFRMTLDAASVNVRSLRNVRQDGFGSRSSLQ